MWPAERLITWQFKVSLKPFSRLRRMTAFQAPMIEPSRRGFKRSPF
jgi:hypothetical protein